MTAAPAPATASAEAILLISDAARLSGISARMLRHYEGLGLLGEVRRSDAGYRRYSPADVHTLRFIKRSRDLGFSMEQVAELVGLWQDPKRNSAEVKKVAQSHLTELAERIAQLESMRRTLTDLVHCCRGDARPDCPILDDLSGLDAAG
jgi:MerR family copper efflux transcriptional regulator